MPANKLPRYESWKNTTKRAAENCDESHVTKGNQFQAIGAGFGAIAIA